MPTDVFDQRLLEHLGDIPTLGVGVSESLGPTDENTVIDLGLAEKLKSEGTEVVSQGKPGRKNERRSRLTRRGKRTDGRSFCKRRRRSAKSKGRGKEGDAKENGSVELKTHSETENQILLVLRVLIDTEVLLDEALDALSAEVEAGREREKEGRNGSELRVFRPSPPLSFFH